MYRPGAVLAQRYRLDEKVGGGGMGEVWRGTDIELERTVAIKTVRSELLDEPGFRERFRAEARTMARIRHPGVVGVHDYFSDAGGAFLVMEFIEGEALSGTLRRVGRLTATRTMKLVAEAAEALQAAHDRGVVHRDIKPGNLMVTPQGRLVLTDFGIARSASSTSLTATGALIGTVSYLAPEQVLGKPAGPQSDVYALGVVAYETLAGRRPFDGESPFDVAMQRLRQAPPPLPGDVPPAVVQVVERALAAEPEQRYKTAAEVAVAARQAAGGALDAPSAMAGPPPGVHTTPTTPSTPPPHARGTPPRTPVPGPPVSPGTAGPLPPPPYAPSPRSPATPYPLSGYQAPRGPVRYPPPPGAPRPYHNTVGQLSMIFGIVSLPLALCCYIGLPLGVAAVVMGGIGVRKVSAGRANNRGQAVAGLICGGIGLGLSLLVFLAGFVDGFTSTTDW
jgi:serine/threonine protein kinase